jgi:glycosyltransferase involved in cell wall biosynthesis
MRSGDRTMGKLRVAFLAGTLGQGGAEKQLFYMVRALQEEGVTVFVYSLTKGEFYEKKFVEIGCPPVFLGKHPTPPRRLLTVLKQTIKDRPHILQSAHFYGNLYVTLAGRAMRRLAIGAIRNNTYAEMKANNIWGNPLLKSPPFMITNSSDANQIAKSMRSKPTAVLPNVIDLAEFTQSVSQVKNRTTDNVVVTIISRLEKFKKTEDFLMALAILRENNQRIMELKLSPEGITFLGRRDDVPDLLAQADIFALTSQYEGCPNVLLEAMAASLPVVTTPAGEAKNIVENGVTGFVVPYSSPKDIASRILELASSQEMRTEMGNRGRQRVANHYSFDRLAGKLLSIYREFSCSQGNQHLLGLLNG